MIPEVWYELLRFIGRKDENFEWRYSESTMCWVYGRVEWSDPHQESIMVFHIVVVYLEFFRFAYPELQQLVLHEAIIKSGRAQ